MEMNLVVGFEAKPGDIVGISDTGMVGAALPNRARVVGVVIEVLPGRRVIVSVDSPGGEYPATEPPPPLDPDQEKAEFDAATAGLIPYGPERGPFMRMTIGDIDYELDGFDVAYADDVKRAREALFAFLNMP